VATPQQLREETAAIAALAVDDLASLLTGVPDEAVRALLFDLLPGVVESLRETAATIAVEWYEEFRTEVDAPGSFEAFVPDLRDPGVESLIGWAESESQDTLNRLSLIEGGVIRRVTNGAREATIALSAADPQSIGTQRYARSSGGCGFCRMLAARGAVYRTEKSATFGAHDSCGCVAIPAFGGIELPVRPYEKTLKNVSDADRARVREYLRTH
jgi:hypothetical protein